MKITIAYYTARVGSWGENELIGMDLPLQTDGIFLEGTYELDEEGEEFPTPPKDVEFSTKSRNKFYDE